MVLKRSKFDANTGNTLRRYKGLNHHEAFTRALKEKASITKSLSCNHTWCRTRYAICFHQLQRITRSKLKLKPSGYWQSLEKICKYYHKKYEIGEIGGPHFISQIGVPYSLNKSERWSLPELIRQTTLMNRIEEAIETKQPKRGIRKRKNQGRLEISGECAVNIVTKDDVNTKRKNQVRAKSWNARMEVLGQKTDKTSLTYHVEEPNPNHAFRHCIARVKNANYWNREYRVKNTKRPKHQQSFLRECQEAYDELYNDGEEEENEEEEEEEDYFVTEEVEYEQKDTGESQKQSSFENSRLNSMPVNIPLRKVESIPMFGRKYYDGINKENFFRVLKGFISYRDLYDKDDTALLNPKFLCRVQCREIEQHFLRRRLGRFYVEGNCTPRCFGIFARNFLTDGAYMTVDVVDQNGGTSELSVVISNVNKRSAEYLDVEFDRQPIPFFFLVDLFFNFNKMEAYFATNLFKLEDCSMTDPRFVYLLNDYRKNCRIKTIEDVWLDSFDSFREQIARKETEENLTCPICYQVSEVIRIETCGHYLCRFCLKNYLDAKISSGYWQVACPEPQCGEHLHPIGILSFLSHRLQKLYLKKTCEHEVQKSPQMKLCPVEKCNYVAVCEISNDNERCGNPQVLCNCKTIWCFGCRQSDHWPSSCRAYKMYMTSDIDFDWYDLEGNLINGCAAVKICPWCSYPVEKEGGCDHMTCVCGKEFCWRCTTRLNSEGQIHSCNNIDVIKILLDEKKSTPVLSQESLAWYRKAFEYDRSDQLELHSTIWLRDKNDSTRDSTGTKSSCTLRLRKLSLLQQCYKIIQNICVANASYVSRKGSMRSKLFIDKIVSDIERIYVTATFAVWYDERSFLEIEDMKTLEERLNELVEFSKKHFLQ